MLELSPVFIPFLLSLSTAAAQDLPGADRLASDRPRSPWHLHKETALNAHSMRALVPAVGSTLWKVYDRHRYDMIENLAHAGPRSEKLYQAWPLRVSTIAQSIEPSV